MRRIAAVFVTAALVVGVGAVAAPAGATAPAKASKFCKALGDFNLPELGNATSEQEAAATAKQLRKLARKATGKTKRATLTLAQAFQDIGDGDSPSDVIDSGYANAAATFALAALKCLTSNITLPDITLPNQ